ncbi:MAG TPA: hypothetical protein GYA07_04690 [Verrucomicrobia bacterium]|nr:hypothetical protein [Verrucomicrobiota bacterium]HOB32196.1 hypothetical protein [Verrucomicrobiota bacterium]HOP97680.1 hypothetical protein [Verrucomicrobiota bacterium]
MNTPTNSTPKDSSSPSKPGFAPWQKLKGKRVAYLTLPLLVMATIVEFVILTTGWKYQQMVCLPQGMGVTFFGIGPIGATILAVELLKLPLAIWTSSRQGWQKGFMLLVGLPLICLLTFQLVKDMAVYEMTVAMKPASEYLEKASAEEVRIRQLNGELAAIEQKKAERERRLAELTTLQAKAKADIEEALKHNEAVRQDAITLTEYQKKELSEVEARQAAIIKQFNADTEAINKAIAELRARREVEVERASKWNAEEARIENDYKAKMAEYKNKLAAYEKARAEYESANFLKRQLMSEPVHPGVPPERETNTILKPASIAEIDAQIQAREAELTAVNNRRRQAVAQVAEDARRLREEFDRRSSARREETDKKREELLAALTASSEKWKAEQEALDQEVAAALKNVDGIRTQIDAHRKKAEEYYEAREAAIRNTQVHRIATTVEIVRGLIMGERPMSVTASAKERGDILTDQISMVRIWVYPVLAFIVAFLPTLMVEIGFSTVFKPEAQRPAHRLGFLGRRMHWLYTRAGRFKILRAERLAREASTAIAAREEEVARIRADAERALAEKESELQAAREAIQTTAQQFQEEAKRREEEWVAKLAGMADSLNRAIVEKDALKDLQRSEIERQVQMRQHAWSDRINQLRQELDDQRAAAEAERTALMQEHHRRLMEVTEDSKKQVMEARRQMAEAELAAVEKTTRLSNELKEAIRARDAAEAQLKQQADSLSMQVAQAREDAARELEKAARQEKIRLERQQAEFEKALREREEEFERRLRQREQELTLNFEGRLAEEKSRAEQQSRVREAELERQFEARIKELEGHWSREAQQRDEVAEIRLKQREAQLQAQADARLRAVQSQSEEQLRRREMEFERQLDARTREAEARLREQLQERELVFHTRLKQREQELTAKAAARETELQKQFASDLRAREEELERQAESRVRAVEARFAHDAQQREEAFEVKLRQREQELQSRFEAAQETLRAQREQEMRRHEAQLVEARRREEELVSRLVAEAEAHRLAQSELEMTRSTIEPLKAMLARTEKERDEARQAAIAGDREVQELKKKLMDASSLLNGWRNGKRPAGV